MQFQSEDGQAAFRTVAPEYIVLGLAVVVLIILWLGLLLISVMRGRYVSRCPNCNSDRIFRPPGLRMVDMLLRVSFVVSYCCEAFQERFYALSSKKAKPVAQ
jgi:hypothetical protein